MSGESAWKAVISKCDSRLKFLYRQAGCYQRQQRRTFAWHQHSVTLTTLYPPGILAMSQTAKKKLQVVQNKLMRFMLNLGPSDHVGIEKLNKLGLLNVDGRAEQLRIHNAHKVFYKQAPVYLIANFNKCRNRRNEHTTQGIQF